jgi:hypothetical protein
VRERARGRSKLEGEVNERHYRKPSLIRSNSWQVIRISEAKGRPKGQNEILERKEMEYLMM